ncbi:MAG: eukaryotic-like serine/threonine-protein kinase [Actinomycetota bacterium]|nr:eukaryotic-like serine/threonine-protein kinase [Actinomycetota bacterium]
MATAVLTAASAIASDWPQFHNGLSRTGANWTETSIGPRNVGTLTNRWRVSTGTTKEGINSSPVIANGVVYVGSDDHKLRAISTTGKVLWAHSTKDKVRSSPAVAGGVVYVGSNDGHVYAWKTGGQALWVSKSLGGQVSASPLVVNGVVYVGSHGGQFFALKASTGQVLWSSRTWTVWDSASFDNGTVFVGSDQGRVFALAAGTGKQKWSTGMGSRVRGTPVVANGRVIAGTDAGRVIALNESTGKVQWNTSAVKNLNGSTIGTGVVRGAPAVAGGKVFVPVGGLTMAGHPSQMWGTLWAIDAKSGRKLWQGWHWQNGKHTPALADWTTVSPAYANGVVYVASNDHRLYAFRTSDGFELAPVNDTWTDGSAFKFPRGMQSSPAIVNGRLYIGCRDGYLYSLGLK